jgi:hypothetical protein
MRLKLLNPDEKKADIFDRVGRDLMDRTELDAKDQVLFDPELRKMIAEEVRKAVAAIKISMPPPMPQKETVREIRVEVPQKDNRQLVEKSELEKALKKIEELEKKLTETDEIARTPAFVPGGSGVIGIPPPEAAAADQVLTVVDTSEGKKARWAAGGGGSGLSGYTVNNGSELKTFDVASGNIDDLFRVVGTIIEDLS